MMGLMSKEKGVVDAIRNQAIYNKCVLFKNTVGMFKAERRGGSRPVKTKTGLGTGSSDLIGYTKKTITPDMVGKTVAIFTAIEVKREGWNKNKKLNPHEQNQANFIARVKEDGGIAGFSASIDDFNNVLKEV
jgi:hypothetical protein